LGIPVLEDKLLQCAATQILLAICERGAGQPASLPRQG